MEVDTVYEGDWGTYNEGPVYVAVGGTVDLWAEPYPGDYENYPEDEPTWDIEQQPSGANATITVDPDWTDEVDVSGLTVPGDYVISAKCGSYDDGDDITIVNLSMNVTVHTRLQNRT